MGLPNSGFAEIFGVPLAYEVIGSGQPLVLLHEGFADSRMYNDQIAAFSTRYRVIRYDRHGSGLSGVPAYSYTDHGALRDLLRYLGVTRASVLGMSAGGGVALDFTLAYPEMVNALILAEASVGGFAASDATARGWAAFGEALERGDAPGAVELLLHTWVDGPTRSPDVVAPAVRERMREMMAHWVVQPRVAPQPLELAAIGRLDEIGVPTLVIAADGDVADIVVQAELLHTGIRGAAKATISDVAHVPNMERSEKFNCLVLDFLDA